MKLSPLVLAAVIAAMAGGGCSTPDARVAKNTAAFESWPQEVQAKVRAGQVAVGFTAEQVRTALGEPDRKLTRMEAQASREVWVYFERGPKFSFGVGASSGGGGSGFGGGVGVSTDKSRDPERLRVIFAEGRVSAIEEVKR